MCEKLGAYERPAIEVLRGLDSFFDCILRRKPDLPADVDWRARRIKEFIDSHPLEPGRNLDDVCSELGLLMSGRQARRLFRLSIGLGIRDYARNRRLAVAVDQLEGTSIPVKAIAADLGYQSTRQFRRRFKEFFGLSPVEFRKVTCSRGTSTKMERLP
jgi:AraC family transcriptional regulator of arabinose operon